ncbi:hypothetical protein K431DRAFT_296119 [Polychaeton citri CBS 116435]|uniref:Uncharacterized protein n=1 Tax=Polychaeton citri CBS 116435 TaxID=1314669 RepID=A0A9P4UKT5_9PEZI|nr:hypothetical protein K431DRAFT_296119 [Polychaeton citri CBS 116435]
MATAHGVAGGIGTEGKGTTVQGMTHEGLPEARKRTKYMFRTMAVGLFLMSADETVIQNNCRKKACDIVGRKATFLSAYVIFAEENLFCGGFCLAGCGFYPPLHTEWDRTTPYLRLPLSAVRQLNVNHILETTVHPGGEGMKRIRGGSPDDTQRRWRRERLFFRRQSDRIERYSKLLLSNIITAFLCSGAHVRHSILIERYYQPNLDGLRRNAGSEAQAVAAECSLFSRSLCNGCA